MHMATGDCTLELRWHYSKVPSCTKDRQELSSCWDGRPFGHNKHGPKTGGCCSVLGEAVQAGSPSNTVWPGPKPTSVPSGTLIHPTVWSQYTNVTDRQTARTGQTDNGPIAQGEPFYKRSLQNGILSFWRELFVKNRLNPEVDLVLYSSETEFVCCRRVAWQWDITLS